MAAEEGARAGQAARARARAPAAPRAGDGRALAASSTPAAAANNLNQAVHAARRALGADAIEARDELLRARRPTSTSTASRRPRPPRGAAGTAAAYRAALAALRRRAAAREPLRRLGREPRDELERLHAELARTSSHGSERRRGAGPAAAATSSFVGRGAVSSRARGAARRGHGCSRWPEPGGAGKTRLALELARTVRGRRSRTAPCSSSWRPCRSRARRRRRRRRARRARAPGAGRSRRARRLPRAARAAARARQLRAPPGGERRARRRAPARAAPSLTIARDEPRAAATSGRGRLPRPVARDPGSRAAPAAGRARALEAVRLFVERAAAVAPGLLARRRTTPADVARICFRLDGLPLAVELAAGRVGGLGPAAIAERLDDRFRLLRAGAGAAPTRQQTLAATLRWSHDLLEPERARPLPPARRVRRRLRARRRRGRVRRRRARPRRDRRRPRPPGREVARQRGGARRRAPLPAARDRPALRAGAARRTPARRGRSRCATRTGRSRSPRREADGPALDRRGCEPARGARHADRRRARTRRSGSASVCCRSGCRRIDLREGRRRLAEVARGRAGAHRAPRPRRCSRRPRSPSAAGTIARRPRARRGGARRRRSSSATPASSGRCCQRLADFTVALGRRRASASRVERRADLRAAGGARRPPRRVSVYALGCASGSSATSSAPSEHARREPRAVPAAGPDELRLPSPLNIGELPLDGSRGLLGPRVLFEDTLQPFIELPARAAVAHVLVNQAGARPAARRPRRARELFDEGAQRFEVARRRRGRAARSPAGVSRSSRAGDSRPPAAELGARSSSGRAERPARDRHGAHRPRPRRHGRRATTSAPSCGSARPATLPPGRRPLGARELALAPGRTRNRRGASSTRPRTRSSEALRVLGETTRTRWLALTTLDSTEVALARGEPTGAAKELGTRRPRTIASRRPARRRALDARAATLR